MLKFIRKTIASTSVGDYASLLPRDRTSAETMTKTLYTAAMLAITLSACSKPEPKPLTQVPPLNTDIPVVEVMDHVMNPAAYAFWAGSGVEITREGERDLTPKTDKEWESVESGAATVVIGTNALMSEVYVREPRAEWYAAAKKVADIAMRGKQAAEHHDAAALDEIGAELDVACDDCHLKFDPRMRQPPPQSSAAQR